jgi:hypothetical protein
MHLSRTAMARAMDCSTSICPCKIKLWRLFQNSQKLSFQLKGEILSY